VLTVNSYTQDNYTAAASFFKQVIKTYFDRDCNKFYTSIADTVCIISLYGDTVIEKSKLKPAEEICEKFDSFISGIKSYAEYIDHYKIIVLSKAEFTSKGNSLVLERIKNEEEGDINRMVYDMLGEYNRYFTEHDFLVFGNLPAKKGLPALNDGAFWMIVRKTSNGWKLFGGQP
jgi:hypothetical protein